MAISPRSAPFPYPYPAPASQFGECVQDTLSNYYIALLYSITDKSPKWIAFIADLKQLKQLRCELGCKKFKNGLTSSWTEHLFRSQCAAAIRITTLCTRKMSANYSYLSMLPKHSTLLSVYHHHVWKGEHLRWKGQRDIYWKTNYMNWLHLSDAPKCIVNNNRISWKKKWYFDTRLNRLPVSIYYNIRFELIDIISPRPDVKFRLISGVVGGIRYTVSSKTITLYCFLFMLSWLAIVGTKQALSKLAEMGLIHGEGVTRKRWARTGLADRPKVVSVSNP